MSDMPTMVSPEPQGLVPVVPKPTVDARYRVGSLNNIRAGWFGYRSYDGYTDNDYSGKYYCSWEHCRDRVQIINRDHIIERGLWFAHRKGVGPNIRLFFKKLERQLKVKPRSTFEDTEFPEICIWMNVSPWWMENLVRRSFLTLALRSAQNYKPRKDNFLQSFEKNRYGKESMTAVNLFLAGYTNYRGKRLHMFEGWSRLFREKGEEAFKAVMFPRASKNNVSQTQADW
jgi:hypothetical protein